jgi:hypothetical protein
VSRITHRAAGDASRCPRCMLIARLRRSARSPLPKDTPHPTSSATMRRWPRSLDPGNFLIDVLSSSFAVSTGLQHLRAAATRRTTVRSSSSRRPPAQRPRRESYLAHELSSLYRRRLLIPIGRADHHATGPRLAAKSCSATRSPPRPHRPWLASPASGSAGRTESHP